MSRGQLMQGSSIHLNLRITVFSPGKDILKYCFKPSKVDENRGLSQHYKWMNRCTYAIYIIRKVFYRASAYFCFKGFMVNLNIKS